MTSRLFRALIGRHSKATFALKIFIYQNLLCSSLLAGPTENRMHLLQRDQTPRYYGTVTSVVLVSGGLLVFESEPESGQIGLGKNPRGWSYLRFGNVTFGNACSLRRT